MRRLGLVLLAACGLVGFLALDAPIAAAHTGSANITCTSVQFIYNANSGFTSGTNTVNEFVFLDNNPNPVATGSVTFVGDVGATDTIAISVPAGTHTVKADAILQGVGEVVGFPVIVTVTCSGPSGTGELTPGFWKNHQAATTALLPQTLGTYVVSTFAQAQAVFEGMNCGNSTAQNAVGCLAGELLAAQLNEANGAASPACVTTAIGQANSFLSSVGYVGPTGTYTLTAAQRASAVSLAGSLDNFNNGSLTC